MSSSAYPPDDDLDMLAADYVLGTLDPAERAMVAARRMREPSLEAAIIAWDARLAPLAETIPSIAPPPDLFASIEQGLAAQELAARRSTQQPEQSASLVPLLQQRNRWRMLALAASSIAAALAVVVGIREFKTSAPPQSFVAVLQKDAASPAFLVSVDLVGRSLTVTPVAAEKQPDKSYELWLVNDALGGPKSLGLIKEAGFTTAPGLNAFAPDIVKNGVLAVSLEPVGGSKIGAPSGPVLFTGKLIEYGL